MRIFIKGMHKDRVQEDRENYIDLKKAKLKMFVSRLITRDGRVILKYNYKVI